MKVKLYFVMLVILLFLGCVEIPDEIEELEEDKGSGSLSFKSSPAGADIFLNGEVKGKTPLKLYGIDVGSYVYKLSKGDYEDYESVLDIEAGRVTEINVNLNEIITEDDLGEEEPEVVDEEEEVIEVEEVGTLFIDKGVLKYYDFSEKKFTDKLVRGVDVFSKRYQDHLLFTRYSGATVKVVDKKFENIEEDDCLNTFGSIGNLYTDQTLCVKTKEGLTAAIGGSWGETTIGSKLKWKMFS